MMNLSSMMSTAKCWGMPGGMLPPLICLPGGGKVLGRAGRGGLFAAIAHYTLVSSVLARCSPGHELPRLGQTLWASLGTIKAG